MSDSIQVALIGLSGSVLGSLLGILASSKLTQYRLEQLERKVEKHNNIIDRTYKLEADELVIEERLREINETVGRLQKYHEE